MTIYTAGGSRTELSNLNSKDDSNRLRNKLIIVELKKPGLK